MLKSQSSYGEMNMATKIITPIKRGVGLICFLQAEGRSAAEIHCRMSIVYRN